MADDDDERSLRSRLRKLSTVQQRFEDSAPGKVVISGLVLVIVIVGVVFNLPDSPIARSLVPAVQPVAAPLALDQGWAMYAEPEQEGRHSRSARRDGRW